MNQQQIQNSIDEASKKIGKTWPLYSFVTSNPLSGYERIAFQDALNDARELFNANMFPDTILFRQAWEEGKINEKILLSILRENGYEKSPEFYLEQLNSKKNIAELNANHDLDRIMAKWLANFMDEGLAEWEMPAKRKGFYKAWRKLAPFDSELEIFEKDEIPKTASAAITKVLQEYSEEEYTKIFSLHLAALPGWTGYIKYRMESDSSWQKEYPITLKEYLGVRLWIAKLLKVQILPNRHKTQENDDLAKLQYIWLKAWEHSWQHTLIDMLGKEAILTTSNEKVNHSYDAQMVFCIDTRSELIRRHLEAKGNYETFGYAGFFGIAMDYKNPKDALVRKSCPPIVSSAYSVSEIPRTGMKEHVLAYKKKNDRLQFWNYFLKRMKNMLPSTYGYVEGGGLFYGLLLLIRTLIPGYAYRFKKKNTISYEPICEPEINRSKTIENESQSLSLDEKVAIVKSAFDLMGWTTFAPLVLFVGHGSQSANNPFSSSLDCGACAASPGRHNARMLAKLANAYEVRRVLAENYQFHIPAETIFIGAEHNTTTDDIIVFDTEVPDSHIEPLAKVKADLLLAKLTATEERLGLGHSIKLAEKKANNWGETRPEWGLAKNAGFIVGPRTLTKNNNLDGRCFLHSYDWEIDLTGKALEGIMQGPMVVTQWINNHYYFSTVDNDRFGSGSKITQNITGRFGVVQGNGGDLKMGLPLQSLNQSDEESYHQPLRLTVLIQAPVKLVSNILLRNENLKDLLDNEWIYLMVMDPLERNEVFLYKRNLQWVPTRYKQETKNAILACNG